MLFHEAGEKIARTGIMPRAGTGFEILAQLPDNRFMVCHKIRQHGWRLQFSNTNAFGSGLNAGSIEFFNSDGEEASFEPPGFGAGRTRYDESSPFAGTYMATNIPEPSAFILLGTGLLVCLAWTGGEAGESGLARRRCVNGRCRRFSVHRHSSLLPAARGWQEARHVTGTQATRASRLPLWPQ